MTINSYIQLILYMVALIALAKPLGWYMARVYDGQPVGLNRVFGPIERGLYRLFGTREDAEMEELEVNASDAVYISALSLVDVRRENEVYSWELVDRVTLGA